ncbi:hypothetical protein PspLS_06072 [Pyricularia sp. CBS 133598]|nr:hypothetical protein PspLS_06072 [Pyricularia sp. CBS 133598]
MASPAADPRVDDTRGHGHAGRSATNESTPLLARQDEESRSSQPALWEKIKAWRRDRAVLAGLLLLVAVALIVTIVVLAVNPRGGNMNSSGALCLTPACVHAASEFLYSLSPKYQQLDACTNFDEMVCGGWRQVHSLRSDQGLASSLSVMGDNGQNLLRTILESPYPDQSTHSNFSPRNLAVDPADIDRENFNQLQRAYNSCMAVNELKKVGIEPIQVVLSELSSTIKDTKDLSDTILYMEKLGIPHFENLGASADDKDPNVIVISASPRYAPGLSSKAYYSDDSVLSAYQDAMQQVLKSVLPNAKTEAKGLAESIVKLEKDIAAVTPSLSDLRDVSKTYNEMSLQDTAKLAPQLGIDKVLKALAPSNYTIDRMITAFPGFLGNVSKILTSAKPETVKGFLQWKVIQSLASAVDAPELKPLTQFNNKLAGRDPDSTSERYRTCLSAVDSGLGWTLSRFYVESAFSAKAKELGNQVILDIKDVFSGRIDAADWMDKDAQKVAKEKVKNIVQKIGYPDQSPNITNPQALKDYYASLSVGASHFNNTLEFRRFEIKKSWAQLGKPTDKSTWDMTASTVNAYYNPPYNEIVFPAGIMQFPLFGEGLPNYINYAGFGAVAGHELSHAFDNNGRLYDLNGYLKDWWSNKTIEEFKKRADCFVKEYSNFTVEGTNGTIHVKGEQTLGENIADAGGLSAAFSAWQTRTKDAPDPHLPGLEFFTKEQLFYVAFGNVWCSKYTPQALTQRVIGDEHSPNMWRIMGTAMMNSRGFKQAYNCPVKEPTCEIW